MFAAQPQRIENIIIADFADVLHSVVALLLVLQQTEDTIIVDFAGALHSAVALLLIRLQQSNNGLKSHPATGLLQLTCLMSINTVIETAAPAAAAILRCRFTDRIEIQPT